MKVEDLLIAGIPLGALILTKFASGGRPLALGSSITKKPGETIRLTCNVTNKGNVEISDLGLKPILLGPKRIELDEWDAGSLSPGQTIMPMHTYALPSDPSAIPAGDYRFFIKARDISDNTDLGEHSTDWTVTIQGVKSISISNVSLS